MAISFFSHKSTVWNTSRSDTPYALHAAWNLRSKYNISIFLTWVYLKKIIIFTQSLLVDVFHHFEISTRCVDFVHATRFDFVDQFTENDSIPKVVFVCDTSWEFPAQNGFDPFLSFFVLLRVAFAGDLAKQ